MYFIDRFINYKFFTNIHIIETRGKQEEILWPESSVSERWLWQCVYVTLNHQALTADTWTIEPPPEKRGFYKQGTFKTICTAGLQMKPYISGCSQEVQNLAGSGDIQCSEHLYSHSSSRQHFSLPPAGCFWKDCWRSISRGAVVTLLSFTFNPERHNVRAAVREPSRLHQGVVWRWCVEAGQGESRCQVALICHPPGTTVLEYFCTLHKISFKYSVNEIHHAVPLLFCFTLDVVS